MVDKEDYLTSYRVFFETFAATVNPEDQLPVNIAGYTITEAELPGEVVYWTTQYLTEKLCPPTLLTPLLRIILDEVQTASKKQPNDFGYKADESVYLALRLMQAVTARVNAVCLRYLDNSKLDSLPPPPAHRELKTASSAAKNSRRAMEDRHVEIGNLEALFGIETTDPTSFYAVYDGHAGSAAATYCAAHLHQYLTESPHFTSDVRKALREAFVRTDREFVRKREQEQANGGSTAIAVCIRGRCLHAAWAGDSLALLAKRMRLMQLVRAHKPDRPDEKERIESSGGTVMYWGTWRVNGQLAVSRAIGDAQYKPYVTAHPDIATVDLDGDEDFVVVACDGLWDYVSEDDVALTIYRQIAADPDDLKAVTQRLIVQAKWQGSCDNISVIVVFLKDPHQIAADNCPPMDLGLDNALNGPPFDVDTGACKRPLDTASGVTNGCAETEAEVGTIDNGVEDSDSDSEDLGPETAVDVDDVDADRNHEPAAPTPPAHTVDGAHVEGALVDNVAESDSEDEWNYFKGEGEREDHNPSEDADEPPHSETPCQDNSVWESSSVDMNSSPLNPDAPVFIPGTATGSDVLLAESPRKPLPMDDIELPDVAQFETEAVVRPAELLDLDNSDQLNGHHNMSLDEATTENLNGNEKCDINSLSFGFDTDKAKDTSLIQDLERIQKDTTDFCNIQVFQAHTEMNPFASEDNNELLERLKNKERDPMSMSFYQEKDDDTCERLPSNDIDNVDLNAVRPLPDSEDEDELQTNGVYDNIDEDKENLYPNQNADAFSLQSDLQEPDNDRAKLDDRSDILNDPFAQGDVFLDNNVKNTLPNIDFEASGMPQENILQTDTPESHKLLFEQIPEIPDGKSSELGFASDDIQDPESEQDNRTFSPQEESQDVEMVSKIEDSPCEENVPEFIADSNDSEFNNLHENKDDLVEVSHSNEFIKNSEILKQEHSTQPIPKSPLPLEDNNEAGSPEPTHNIQENFIVDVHQNNEQVEAFKVDDSVPLTTDLDDFVQDEKENVMDTDVGNIMESDLLNDVMQRLSPAAPECQASPVMSPAPIDEPALVEAPISSPLPTETANDLLAEITPDVAESPAPTERVISPEAVEIHPSEVPLPSESPVPQTLDEPIAEPTHTLLENAELGSQAPMPVEAFEVENEQETVLMEEQLQESIEIEKRNEKTFELNDQMQEPVQSEEHLQELVQTKESVPNPIQIEEQNSERMQKDDHIVEPVQIVVHNETSLQIEEHREEPTEAEEHKEEPVQIDEHKESAQIDEQKEEPLQIDVNKQEPVQTDEHKEEPIQIDEHKEEPVQIDEPEQEPVQLNGHKMEFGQIEHKEEPVLIVDHKEESAQLAEHKENSVQIEYKEEPLQIEEHKMFVQLEPALSAGLYPVGDIEEAKEVLCDSRLEPEVSGPAPDVVPEEYPVAVEMTESHAQEICVPVTSEIATDVGTPPPTPAVQDNENLAEIPLAAAVTAAAATAAAAAIATTAVKKTTTKKSSTTPTPKSTGSLKKPPATKTPTTKSPSTAPKAASTTKAPSRPTPTAKAPTPRTTPAKPASGLTKSPVKEEVTKQASKPLAAKPTTTKPAPATKTALSRPATAPAKTAARPSLSTAAAKPATTTAKPAPKPATTRPAPAPRTAPATKPATTAAKPPMTKPPSAATTKPAAAPKAPRAPISRPATAPTRTAEAKKDAKPAEKKPLLNGDVKKTEVKKAAPRPAPRAAAPLKMSSALDKGSKELANKRLNSKTAPPRTVPAKSAAKPSEKPAPIKKPPAVSNGHPEPAAPADAALPDVIA